MTIVKTMNGKNALLDIFRAKVTLSMTQYADRLKVFIAENKFMGSSLGALREQKDREFSRWTFNRDKLGKDIKREVAGLVNKAFLRSYLDELKNGK
jgi:hypothetical protein